MSKKNDIVVDLGYLVRFQENRNFKLSQNNLKQKRFLSVDRIKDRKITNSKWIWNKEGPNHSLVETEKAVLIDYFTFI